jgi:hypothetical protein
MFFPELHSKPSARNHTITYTNIPVGVRVIKNVAYLRDRSLFIPGVGTEEIWVG